MFYKTKVEMSTNKLSEIELRFETKHDGTQRQTSEAVNVSQIVIKPEKCSYTGVK